MLDNLYRQVIMDHYRQKRNFEEIKGENIRKIHYKNPTCGDVMTLFLDLEQDRVRKAAFLGEGCSISMASASMMTELIENKSLKEIASLRKAFEDLIRHGNVTDKIDLGDSLSLQGVHKLKARHNCALMTWQALDKVLKDEKEYNSL
ncbi:Fe-S cluster assembly sulfur transfer protein SufU [Metabacillus sediminilitoris]|uniref:SUF system NifU family Fe-S cluster assembly protein n=1 Tax=Metabacillus sediminilitoris TaxID=2567941 RepID=A0A4V3WE50_9BACI|nr:SUF system NifU family Fe-S cluster assembly protein [Metabacillus sediminilitoris]QGQ45732.1 SUF system NifU family Fe-S cluster assembly protein [Metabacillus sediminilitoris]THF74886.1 SUF system NifU family Fe-S cluster assembly protein [Metabacillus sediminilitoris]